MKQLQEDIIEFRDKRGWGRVHTLENLAKSISIESAELLELYQWTNNPSMERVEEEIADIIIYTLTFCNDALIDIENAVKKKMIKNGKKYPENTYAKNVQ